MEAADLLAEYFNDPPDGLESLSARTEGLYRQTLELRLRTVDGSDPGVIANRENLARLLIGRATPRLARDAFAEAEPDYREAVELLRQTRPEGDRGLVVIESHLGRCLSAMGRFAEAESLLVAAYRAVEDRLSASSATRQMLLNRIVDLYERWGKTEDAENYRKLLSGPSVTQFLELDRLDVRGHHGGAFSAELDGRSVWVFRGTESGYHVPIQGTMVAALWTDARDVSPSRFPKAARPARLLPWTAEELDYNLGHGEGCLEDCGSHWSLEPGPVVADPDSGRAFVFYEKRFSVKAGPFDEDSVGTSIAVLEEPGMPARRPVIRPGAKHPTLLFGPEEPRWGNAALIGNGFLYAYGCRFETQPSRCLLARVEVSRVLDRAAWRFYAGQNRWILDWRRARPVLSRVPWRFSVHWNAFLGKFLAIHSAFSSVSLRVADRPEGPWSDPIAVVEGLAPGNWFAVGHPQLAQDGGRVEYLTYYRSTYFLGGEIRLVEVTLG